nr:RNA-directed DNA polymerase, eukaryota, reverse transcriptase zinc-binding domain protein [Tanacetum cinerariifolium]
MAANLQDEADARVVSIGKVFWVRAKKVPGWIPDFVKDNDEEKDSKVGSYEEVPNGEDVTNVEDLEGDSDGEIVPDTKFEEDFSNQKGEEDSVRQGNVQLEEGDVVIMGDFNEVSNKSKRFGTLFNRHGADVFNHFISNAVFEEVPLEGCSFTWCHKSATKISEGENNVVNRRTEVVNLLQEVEKKNSLEAAQKEKIKWAIEGDENSKYYHGAVWDCEIDKSPGPDGFTFGFYRRYWKLIENDVADAVDFKKAYDSVRWDYLYDIMRKVGFGEKWCMWIQSCLRSSRGSVIVNESPTEESQFYIGLKQGQWSESNIDTIMKVLDFFNRATGLRINMTISVEDDKVKGGVEIQQFEHMKEKVKGCILADMMDRLFWALEGSGGFVNLSHMFFADDAVFVGQEMSRSKSWCEVVDRAKKRLSKWKLKTLSIGGRLTLLKSVLGFIPIFHMSIKASWVKWKMVLAFKDRGGLGVSSLYALNRGLLFKWLWRFYSKDSSLWAKVIMAIHGSDGKVEASMKAVGNGENIMFWEDTWNEGGKFKCRFPRMYALESCKSITVERKLAQSSLIDSFRRSPRGGAEQQQYKPKTLIYEP